MFYMTLAQLQVFVAAAKAGSFTRAAEDIGLTQSAVSQMINSLEKELGVALFHRSRNGITTTSIGERMLQHAREILQITSCMAEEASSARGFSSGTLRIASISSMASRILPGLLGAFRKKYPAVEITLFEGKNDEIHHWLSHSVVDIGITVFPEKELQTIPLIQENLMVILPQSDPLHDQPHLSFDQIEERCFIMQKDTCYKSILLENSIHPKATIEVRDPSTIVSMVQEGIGVSIMPELSIPLTTSKVRMIPLNPSITRQMFIAVRNWQTISPLTAEFALHCQKYVEES